MAASEVQEINQMLRNMPSDWQTQLAANRNLLRSAGASADQIPPEHPDAFSVLRALNLNNRDGVSSEAAAGQDPPDGVVVPDDVKRDAMQGVRDSYKNNYGGYNFIGVARAIQLVVSKKISKAAKNRMRMYFDRKVKQDRLSDQFEAKKGKRYWSWLNWGGDAGARWSGSKRFAELVKGNPMLPVPQNFLFSKADLESMDAAQRAALIKHRTAELGDLYADLIIVRAPGKPSMFGGKVGPAYYMVSGFSARSLEDTSEYGMPTTYSELPSAGYLLHAFDAFSKTARSTVALLDAYTGTVRKFDSINAYNAAVKAAKGDWELLMANNNRGRTRLNPFFVTTGGQAVPQAPGEDPRTWEASAFHAQRHEAEGRNYKIVGPDEAGRWFVLDRRTGQVVTDPKSGSPKYGMTKEGAQEVLMKLARRTNPSQGLSRFERELEAMQGRGEVYEPSPYAAPRSPGTRQAARSDASGYMRSFMKWQKHNRAHLSGMSKKDIHEAFNTPLGGEAAPYMERQGTVSNPPAYFQVLAGHKGAILAGTQRDQVVYEGYDGEQAAYFAGLAHRMGREILVFVNGEPQDYDTFSRNYRS